MRVREYYAYGLIAGISITEARHMLPGWVLDCYKIRAEYDARLAGVQMARSVDMLVR